MPLRPASHQRAAQRTPRAHAAAALRVPLVAVHGHVASRSHGHQAPILRLPRESYILLVDWERSLNLVLVDELELGMETRPPPEHAFERASHRLDGEG